MRNTATSSRACLLLVAVACLAFAPAPFPRRSRPVTGDLKALQGEWVWTKGTLAGGDFVMDTSSLSVSGRTLTHLTRGQATARWAAELDTAKEPKRLDCRHLETGRLAVLQIYRLEGDTLTLCWRNDESENGRPIDFEGGVGLGTSVYKRKKP
jgi:uncharacterized protein (TIGR03067 family)